MNSNINISYNILVTKCSFKRKGGLLDIYISRQEAINLLLASIALEELALTNIINAHAENIQYVLGTAPTIEELIRINNIGVKLLENATRNQMLLQFKLEVLLNYLDNL